MSLEKIGSKYLYGSREEALEAAHRERDEIEKGLRDKLSTAAQLNLGDERERAKSAPRLPKRQKSPVPNERARLDKQIYVRLLDSHIRRGELRHESEESVNRHKLSLNGVEIEVSEFELRMLQILSQLPKGKAIPETDLGERVFPESTLTLQRKQEIRRSLMRKVNSKFEELIIYNPRVKGTLGGLSIHEKKSIIFLETGLQKAS